MKNEILITAIKNRYSEEGPSHIASEFGIKPQAVIGLAYRLRIKSVHWHERHGLSKAARNNSVNISYFDVWSPNMAYILGYIWADGCIYDNKLNLFCAIKDESLLASIKQELNSKHPIRYITNNEFNKSGHTGNLATALQICSKNLVKCLIEKHGLQPNKTYKNLPFPNVPEKYLAHFARGNFDGDGCVSNNKSRPRAAIACFLGSHNFIIGLQQRICTTIDIKHNKLFYDNTIVRAAWYSKTDLAALFAWLYPDSNYIFLDRKRKKFQEVIEIQAGSLQAKI